MLIDRDYQVWICVASDDMRPTLQHVNIQPDLASEPDPSGYVSGTAAATDGHILAVVPVKLFAPGEGFDYAKHSLIDPDIGGLLAPSVFKAALKVAKRQRSDRLQIDLSDPDLAGLVDGSLLPRFTDPSVKGSTFPDWAPIVPKRQRYQDRRFQLMAASFQPLFFSRVASAIGCQLAVNGRGSGSGNGLPRWIFGDPGSSGSSSEPSIIEPVKNPIHSVFEPPFGLIMPCHLTAGNDTENFYDQD